jgi:hypothetical protein
LRQGDVWCNTSGLEIDSSHDLILGTGGVLSWRIANTGNIGPYNDTNTRKLGIQLANPACPLHIGATDNEKLLALNWSGAGSTEFFFGFGVSTYYLKCKGWSVQLITESLGNSNGNVALQCHGLLTSLGATTGTKKLNILDSSDASIRIGKQESEKNCFTMQYNHIGDNNHSNNLSFDRYGSNSNFVISSGYGCSIGVNDPSNNKGALHINGGVFGSSVAYKRYNVNDNTYTTGTNAFTISLYCTDNIWCNSSLFTSSDERVKSDVQQYDLVVEEYMSLNPKSYIKNGAYEIGLVAQDVKRDSPRIFNDIGRQAVNKDMKKRNGHDPDDGYQWVLDYDRLGVINIKMIQRLVQEINILSKDLEELNEYVDRQTRVIHELIQKKNN